MDKTFSKASILRRLTTKLRAAYVTNCEWMKNVNSYDRYRYIVVVSIGEKLMQGLFSLVNFLWDAENDGYLSYVVDTPKFFAIATLYYVYYD